MNDFLSERLTRGVMVFDGGIGTEIYRRNFFVNTSFENLNLTSPDEILAIHRNYAASGVDVLTANTFNANRNKLSRHGLGENASAINRRGVELARQAAGESKKDILVAGSVGPVGEINRDLGLTRQEIAAFLTEQATELAGAGADFILFESIGSLRDAEFAVAAAQDITIPYVLSFTLDREAESAAGKEAFSLLLSAFDGAAHQPSALGLNCGAGPESTLAALEKIAARTALPLIVQPNAGAPKMVDGRTMYMTSPEYFTTYASRYLALGARGIGGCCGITPEHIADMARSIRPLAGSAYTPAVVVKETVKMLDPVPTAEKSRLGEKLARGEWVQLVELTPPRGIDLTSTIEKAKMCKDGGFDAINIPDGPRASCRISTVITAIEIQEKAGIETVLHCCCRDRSLIGMQSDILGCSAKKVNNILFITGDPPKLGDYPFSSGVFDVDSIGMVKIQSRLNRGLDIGGKELGARTGILIGVGADPNAIDQGRELDRLRQKVEAGAEYIITQPVFDPEALLRFLDKMPYLNTPVIAGIWPLVSYRNAEFMRNEVPGVVVPDSVMRRMLDAGEDKNSQRAAGTAIAREAVASIRGCVSGIATSAPFGNVKTAMEVVS